MPERMPRSPLIVPVLAAVVACGGERGSSAASTEADVDGTEAPSLQVATEIGLRNARQPLPGLVSGGQPTVPQLEALAQAGFTNFVSLRPSTEEGAGWEEADATSHGHGFARLPISGASSLTRENVEAFAAILGATADEPTVLYCASGNRVGAMLALKAFWLDGETPVDALEVGRRGGMTGLEPAVRELVGLGPA